MFSRWKSHIKQRSRLDDLSLHPAHLSHLSERVLPKKTQATDLHLAVAMPRLEHPMDLPAILGGSVAELGLPGAEPVVSDGRTHSSSVEAPSSCITMTSPTLSQVRQVWVQFQIKKCQNMGSSSGG